MVEQGVSMGLILVIVAVAIIVLLTVAAAALLVARKPGVWLRSIELAELREEIGQLREEVEQLRDEVRQRKTGPTAPGSTDIQSH